MALRPRNEERFAEEVLNRVLGIQVIQRDDQSEDRMVDALFRFPDGRQGALEVSTIGEREALEQEAIAAKKDWSVPGATWAWMVHVGTGVVMRDLERHLPTLVLTCEAIGARNPRLVAYEHQGLDAFEWLSSSNVSMHGFPSKKRPGAIDVLPEGGGGAVHNDLDALPQWLSSRLREQDLTRKLTKLFATGLDELHLFLRVHDTAMPFSLYDPLAFGGSVPSRQLEAPAGLTGLWLAPAWNNPILWWSAHRGWARERLD
jgi:hypothetical protein